MDLSAKSNKLHFLCGKLKKIHFDGHFEFWAVRNSAHTFERGVGAMFHLLSLEGELFIKPFFRKNVYGITKYDKTNID